MVLFYSSYFAGFLTQDQLPIIRFNGAMLSQEWKEALGTG